MTIGQFRQRNERMLAEREALEEALAEAEGKLRAQSEHERMLGEVQKALEDLPRIWEHLEPEERKEVLRLVVDQLTVARRDSGSKVAVLGLRYGPAHEEPV
jgi:plasmid stabilization system protein ParE